MKNSKFIAAGAFVAALALPGYAVAQNAIATTDVNMREGPGTRFQVVTTIPENRAVTLHGCEQGFDWCAVSFANNQGWVFADYLEVSWRGQRHTVSDVGTRIDLPILRATAAAQPRWENRREGAFVDADEPRQTRMPSPQAGDFPQARTREAPWTDADERRREGAFVDADEPRQTRAPSPQASDFPRATGTTPTRSPIDEMRDRGGAAFVDGDEPRQTRMPSPTQ